MPKRPVECEIYLFNRLAVVVFENGSIDVLCVAELVI
jgi:hypothetical protein